VGLSLGVPGDLGLILQTDRLILSELAPADAPFMLELLTSRGFRENIGDRGIADLEGAAAYIGRVRAGYAANGFGLWRCDARADGAPVGTCGLIKRDGLEYPDVGYAFWNPSGARASPARRRRLAWRTAARSWA
jgi:ribosomal-protein-alanine N-acetyltransferase